jgi:hypothetical protein
MDQQQVQDLGKEYLGVLLNNPIVGVLYYLIVDGLRRFLARLGKRFGWLAGLVESDGARVVAFVTSQIISFTYQLWHLVPWGNVIERGFLGGIGLFVGIGIAKPALDKLRDATPGLPTGAPVAPQSTDTQTSSIPQMDVKKGS